MMCDGNQRKRNLPIRIARPRSLTICCVRRKLAPDVKSSAMSTPSGNEDFIT